MALPQGFCAVSSLQPMRLLCPAGHGGAAHIAVKCCRNPRASIDESQATFSNLHFPVSRSFSFRPGPEQNQPARQMLLNGGEMNGVRRLSPKTLAVMTSDQVPPGALRVGILAATQDLSPLPELRPGIRRTDRLGAHCRVRVGRRAVLGGALL